MGRILTLRPPARDRATALHVRQVLKANATLPPRPDYTPRHLTAERQYVQYLRGDERG